MIQISTTTGGLEQTIASLTHFNKDQVSAGIIKIIIDDIKDKSSKGIDTDGQPFKSYTPAYKKKRLKAGKQTDPPNLYWTGRMLNALIGERNGIITTISDADDAGKVEGVNAKRKFIGISKEARIKVIDYVRTFLGFNK